MDLSKIQVSSEQNEFNLKHYQAEFILSRARHPAIFSAWGTGKDLSAIAKCLTLSAESPDNLGLVLRAEYKDLADSTIRDFVSYTGIHVTSDGNATIENEDGRDSHIMFRHIEQLNNLQNINLGFFWINQAEELPDATAFHLLCGRLRRNVKQRTGFVTKNANGHDWAYKIWLEEFKNHQDYPCWQATTYDNADVLPEDYVKSLKNLPENMYKRFVLNDHSIAEGLVWPEFDEPVHTQDSYEIPSEWKVALGLDHGHDHPTAVLFGAVNYDGKLIIYNEHYEAGQLISYHAERIKQIEPDFDRLDQIIDHTTRFKTMQTGNRVYSILESYGDYGFHFRPSISDQFAGIEFVGELFKKRRIVIFKDKCPNLVREIKSWKWKIPSRRDHYTKEEPVRVGEDACKALIYLASGHFGATEKPKPKPNENSVDYYVKQCEKEGLDMTDD